MHMKLDNFLTLEVRQQFGKWKSLASSQHVIYLTEQGLNFSKPNPCVVHHAFFLVFLIIRTWLARHNALRVQCFLHPLFQCECCCIGMIRIPFVEGVCNTGVMFGLNH